MEDPLILNKFHYSQTLKDLGFKPRHDFEKDDKNY